jgi:hypothetical protein
MITASPNIIALMKANIRIPVVEVIVQYPNPNNSLVQGGQLVLDGVIDVTIHRNEEATSDTFDLTIANIDGRYSPFNA